jgi:hypothetical protein
LPFWIVAHIGVRLRAKVCRVIPSLLRRGEHPDDVLERVASAVMGMAKRCRLKWSETVEIKATRKRRGRHGCARRRWKDNEEMPHATPLPIAEKAKAAIARQEAIERKCAQELGKRASGKLLEVPDFVSAPEEIRTPDPQIRSLVLSV